MKVSLGLGISACKDFPRTGLSGGDEIVPESTLIAPALERTPFVWTALSLWGPLDSFPPPLCSFQGSLSPLTHNHLSLEVTRKRSNAPRTMVGDHSGNRANVRGGRSMNSRYSGLRKEPLLSLSDVSHRLPLASRGPPVSIWLPEKHCLSTSVDQSSLSSSLSLYPHSSRAIVLPLTAETGIPHTTTHPFSDDS